MPQIAPIFYAPDVDNAWSVAPGALADADNLAPLQSGNYGSVGNANWIGSTTFACTNAVAAYIIRKVDGTCRLFLCRPNDLDELDNAGTKTNRGTGYTSTTDWSMCAQGDAVIACSLENATQVSTGAGFAALGGSSPKAKFCASNFGFVMLAHTDTSKDQVWWSALYNYTSFAPSIATEAGNVRLLEVPGPITALIEYRDGFVAFKNNGMWLGEYTGPNYIWRWRCISQRIGCVGGKAVTELDGRLFFVHTSGIYSFDGQSITNVGVPINQTFLQESGYTTTPSGSGAQYATQGIASCQAVADDIEGVVWFSANYAISGGGGSTDRYAQGFCYNARSNKWGRVGSSLYTTVLTSSGIGSTFPVLIRTTTADAQTFLADTTGRIFMLWNDLSSSASLRSVRYPYASTSRLTTGVVGSADGAATLNRVHWRTLAGTDSGAIGTITATGYKCENKLLTDGVASGTRNTEFDYGDILQSSRFRTVALTSAASKKMIIAGVGIDVIPQGRR